MMKKKVWAPLLCTVISTVMMAGCAGSGSTEKTSSDSKKAETVTIKFHIFRNEESYNWKSTIAAFEKKYPNIDIVTLSGYSI